jgi:hypothetical protein
MAQRYSIGDIVRTKKTHPCGGDLWEVIRVGADMKIRCCQCGRIVMLDREKFMKRVKQTVKRADKPFDG